ncbi:unnamed protein product [Cuscuta epithymum]|uniref:Uncharacterized protein n=1 Tax=Cuscuta epithymum TaxID=186058 RepID=A0AAV0FN00_9ASTE|nr:unnamed protein product [Cuscuta epithymum]
MPNSYRFISAFIVRYKATGVTPNLELYHYFFRLTPQNSDGFLSIVVRAKWKLFKGAPTSIHEWKNRYFFLRYKDARLPIQWNGYPPKIESPRMTDELEEQVKKMTVEKRYFGKKNILNKRYFLSTKLMKQVFRVIFGTIG